MARSLHSLRSFLLLVPIALVAPVSMMLLPHSAQAQSVHSLRQASDEYRSAVLVFERHVNRASYFDHYDRRLVDRLEDISSDFRMSARNPSDLPRLLRNWHDLTSMHGIVEQSLILGCGRPDPELIRCWQPVVAALRCLATEMHCLTSGHHAPHLSNRPAYDHYRQTPSHNEFHHDGGFGYPNRREFGVQPTDPWFDRQFDPRFGGEPAFQSRQPALQSRPSTPPFVGSHGSHVDSRRDVGAVLAESILNRLLN